MDTFYFYMDLAKEKEIIEEAKKDPEAFGLLYDKYYKPIFNYILRRTANIELAQDLTSQTFFNALKGIGKFRWLNLPFSAWLYRIATNQINSSYRERKKITQVSFEQIPEIPSENEWAQGLKLAEKELESKKEFLKLHQSISKLNPIYQTVIVLRFFDKKKIFEIGQILAKPEGTIKAQIHRALAELKKLMES